jgi:hypothetical protein
MIKNLLILLLSTKIAKYPVSNQIQKETESKRLNSMNFVIDAITFIHLPEGPTAYFKLTSFTPAKAISVSYFQCSLCVKQKS